MAPRIAIAHEWLVRYAGSERVVEEIRRAFPDASLHTTLLDPGRMPPLLRAADTTLLQRIPGATDHHEWLLPLMPLAWRTAPALTDVDAVVSSSHACVRSVRVADGIPHLCYCHTPMRYAWDFASERERFPRPVRPAARAAMALARPWDRRTARRVTSFVANSSAVASRVGRFYGRTARVIHPPVDTAFFTPDPAVERDGFLYVGRLVGYKRPDLAVEAFRDLPYRLTVVGEGHMGPALRATAPPNVSFAGAVSAEGLREHYRSARALVFPANEDFGITMAEALACGTPVIGLSEGGALDIVDPERTGWLVGPGRVDEIRAAVRAAAEDPPDPSEVRRSAERFSAERFRREIAEAVDELIARAAAQRPVRQPARRPGVEAESPTREGSPR